MINWVFALGIWAACLYTVGCAGEIEPGTPPTAAEDEDAGPPPCKLVKVVCEHRPEWDCYYIELCSGNMEEVVP